MKFFLLNLNYRQFLTFCRPPAFTLQLLVTFLNSTFAAVYLFRIILTINTGCYLKDCNVFFLLTEK